MNGLTTRWKVFRVVCIVQLILVAFQLVMSIGGLFYKKNFFYQVIEITCYIFIFWFLYLGLTLLNDNYPDVPLSKSQKRKFNWLFLLNFLLIAFLFAQVVSEWKLLKPIIDNEEAGIVIYLKMDPFLLIFAIVFMLHLIFLAGMFQLRSVIYENTVTQWQQQFEEKSSASGS